MAPLIKSCTAGGTINARRFLKYSADGTVVQAAASSDLIIGASDTLGAASGDRADVIHTEIAEIQLGGSVTRGQQLTADANGCGVVVSAAGQRVGGIALISGVSGDYIPVLVLPGLAGNNAYEIADVAFTVGAEGTNAINVALQLKDAAGNDLAVRGAVYAYLSDDANGDSIIASAHSSGWAIGTDGLLIPDVTNKSGHLVSEADGDIDLTITEAGAKTAYLVVVLPNGTLKVSGAITHAA